MVGRASRTLRSFIRRLRSEDSRCASSKLIDEATYAKNMCKGSKLTSLIELIYSQKPRLMTDINFIGADTVSIQDHVRHVTRNQIEKLLNTRSRKPLHVNVDDHIVFWRDNRRWLGPARVVEVNENFARFIYDEQTLTSTRNQVQRTSPPDNLVEDVANEELFSYRAPKLGMTRIRIMMSHMPNIL